MAEVRIMKLSEIRDKEDLLMRTAGQCRRARASRFRHLDDRLRCLAAGYLLEHCLPGYDEERLRTGRDGKPWLPKGPAFSISHGGDYVVLAWEEGAAGIGVDVEPIRDWAYYEDMLPLYATEVEQKAMGQAADKAIWVWTRKESLYKCVGEGIEDFLELPEVLADEVTFLGKACQLGSWEKEGHLFSVAVRDFNEPLAVKCGMISLSYIC